MPHKHSHNGSGLLWALLITLLMMMVEVAGGVISGSLALLSDAAHMFTDSGALILALFALWFARRPATSEKTFGFYRVEILAALLNGSLLFLIAGYIVYESIQRILRPMPVQGSLMLLVAVIGLFANLLGALILSKGEKHNLNIKAAFWHIVSDAVSSGGVVLGAVIISFTGFYIVDPVLGLLIALLVFRGAWGVVSEAVNILLEAVPHDINLRNVKTELMKIRGVRDIHDIHIWTITSGVRAFSAHVLIDDSLLSKCVEISREMKRLLHDRFNIEHATLEYECESCPEGQTCVIRRKNK